MDITICIVTFKKRLDLFKNLILKIKHFYPEINVLVAINGEYQETFCNNYRCQILDFIANQKNVYPLVIPEFRSLAKLWNTLLIFSKTEYNLVLNDDINFNCNNCIELIQEYIKQTKQELFLLNNSWSHFIITKKILDDLSYFDERLLTLGEEDGDMVWRYIKKYNSYIPSIFIKDINNIADYESKPTNMDCYVDNKPIFNWFFMQKKYKQDPSGISGMFGEKFIKILEDEKQYPYEKFYLQNKSFLKNGEIFLNDN